MPPTPHEAISLRIRPTLRVDTDLGDLTRALLEVHDPRTEISDYGDAVLRAVTSRQSALGIRSTRLDQLLYFVLPIRIRGLRGDLLPANLDVEAFDLFIKDATGRMEAN